MTDSGWHSNRRNLHDGTSSCLPCFKGKRKCCGQRPCTRCTALHKEHNCVDLPSLHAKASTVGLTKQPSSATNQIVIEPLSDAANQPQVIPLETYPPKLKISLFRASPLGICTWAIGTGINYSAWNDARIAAALPTGLPYVDPLAFAALWSSLAPGALGSAAEFLDEVEAKANIPSLPQAALGMGIVPIPEDYLYSLMEGGGLDTKALEKAASAPQADRSRSPLLAHWEVMMDMCAEAALRRVHTPAIRVVFTATRAVPRVVFVNDTFRQLFGWTTERLSSTMSKHARAPLMHPRCVLSRWLSALNMRTRRLRQSKFRGQYLRLIPTEVDDKVSVDARSRTFDATELIRAEYWPSGAIRSATVYLTDIRHRYSDFYDLGHDHVDSKTLTMLNDTPDHFVDIAKAMDAFDLGPNTAPLQTLLWQPGAQPTVLPPQFVLDPSQTEDERPVFARAVFLHPLQMGLVPAMVREMMAAAISSVLESAIKTSSLSKLALDAEVVDDEDTLLEPSGVMYERGPTPGVDLRFSDERYVLLPKHLHVAYSRLQTAAARKIPQPIVEPSPKNSSGLSAPTSATRPVEAVTPGATSKNTAAGAPAVPQLPFAGMPFPGGRPPFPPAGMAFPGGMPPFLTGNLPFPPGPSGLPQPPEGFPPFPLPPFLSGRPPFPGGMPPVPGGMPPFLSGMLPGSGMPMAGGMPADAPAFAAGMMAFASAFLGGQAQQQSGSGDTTPMQLPPPMLAMMQQMAAARGMTAPNMSTAIPSAATQLGAVPPFDTSLSPNQAVPAPAPVVPAFPPLPGMFPPATGMPPRPAHFPVTLSPSGSPFHLPPFTGIGMEEPTSTLPDMYSLLQLFPAPLPHGPPPQSAPSPIPFMHAPRPFAGKPLSMLMRDDSSNDTTFLGSNATLSTPTQGCESKLQIGAAGLLFSCTCAPTTYCCSLADIGAPAIMWAATHRSEVSSKASEAFHACTQSASAAGPSHFQHDVYIPREYACLCKSAMTVHDESVALVQLQWNPTHNTADTTPAGSATSSSMRAPSPAFSVRDFISSSPSSSFVWSGEGMDEIG